MAHKQNIDKLRIYLEKQKKINDLQPNKGKISTNNGNAQPNK